ncbi:MAG TPA: methionine biosynthesis protein MetW [Burkholderiales bacterium]|nr:methionine biosynthesis protein MetW [Burkholderiales bacterium]
MRSETQAPVAASRADYTLIAQWVSAGSKVLDLGCGDGSLLRYLKETRGTTAYGIEIADQNILDCIRNGVNVIQSDLERGLSGFKTNSFDYVILSQTLQAVRGTEAIIREMLRVGREGIVTFPNFGYWRHRFQVLSGRMPMSSKLPYHWYDTPNIHLCTIHDFEALCRDHGVHILERVVLSDGRQVSALPNLLGDLAIYRFAAGG